MTVIIGVDPHKASHTAVAISDGEEELDRKKVRSGCAQLAQLVLWAEPFSTRTWAIESASGLGYLLAQQLVAAGETVVDVPATLASRARLLSTGRSNKNDPNDALSVAVAALRSPGLRRVEAVGHGEVLRLLAKRNIDIGNQRSRVVCRMHSLLAELAGGGIAERELGRKPTTRKLTKSAIKALVHELKDIVAVLADADPDDKRAIYDELGVNLTYHQDGRVHVAAGARVLRDRVGGGTCGLKQLPH